MLQLDIRDALNRLGVPPLAAQKLVRDALLPPYLDDYEWQNLEFLAKHTDLTRLCRPYRLPLFLAIPHAKLGRMEAIPDWFHFTKLERMEYMDDPLAWRWDLYDWMHVQDALKPLVRDPALAHAILYTVLAREGFADADVICRICAALVEINSNPAAMEGYLKDSFGALFRCDSGALFAIGLLIALAGRQNALPALIRNPRLPLDVARMDWNALRCHSVEELESLLRAKSAPGSERMNPITPSR